MAKKSVFISLFLLWLLLPLPAASQSVMEAHNKLCDRTLFFYEKQHGNQIEYFAPNGFAYLWYPGNRRSVPSQWRLAADKKTGTATICFKYPRWGYNPVTKQYGGKWECRPFSRFWSHTNGKPAVGDVFNLSVGMVPFRLSNHPQLNPDEPMRGKKPREIDSGCEIPIS